MFDKKYKNLNCLILGTMVSFNHSYKHKTLFHRIMMKKLLFTLALAVALPLHVPIQAKNPLAQAKVEKLASKWPLNTKQTVILVAIAGILYFVNPIDLLVKLIMVFGLFFVLWHSGEIASAIKKRDFKELLPKIKKYVGKSITITKSMIDGWMNQGEINEIII